MLTELISTIGMLGLIVLAILIMTRAISLDDAVKAIGKVFLVIAAVLVAVCSVRPALQRGVTALAVLLTTVLRFLLVTVSVVAVLILFAWLLLRFLKRSNADSSRD